MMRSVLTALALLILASHAFASKPWYSEAESRFGVQSMTGSFVDSSDQWTVFVRAWSQRHTDSTKGFIRVGIGPGAVLVEGDTTANIYPRLNPRWPVKLKRTAKGPVTIRSSLQVEGKTPGSYDLCESLLEVDFRLWHQGMDTVLVRDQRVIRTIAVRDGMRFRYDGMRFVAIEDDEKESPRGYQERATLVSSTEIRCAECGLYQPLEIPVVVTVGSKGRVTWAKPDHGHDYDPDPVPKTSLDSRVWAAVDRGLRRFKYRAAVADGRAVADYIACVVP